jgi:hypothetical protein
LNYSGIKLEPRPKKYRLKQLIHPFSHHFIMKNARLLLALLAIFGLSAFTANAAELASAKVLSVTGFVNSYIPNGSEKPTGALGISPSDTQVNATQVNATQRQVAIGDILKREDSIVTAVLSSAHMVFSNGSELTVNENTSITVAELAQEAFGGNKSYEQLQADPSKSQAVLTLNYGKVSGHVKQLREGSTFYIQTPLGTAAIRGTKYEAELRYNTARREFILIVKNMDGKVDILSRYVGSFEYGRGKVGDKGFELGSSNRSEPIPPAHTIVIRLSVDDPNYDVIIDKLKNFAPEQNEDTQPETTVPPTTPEVTPEDNDTVITSPNEPAQ